MARNGAGRVRACSLVRRPLRPRTTEYGRIEYAGLPVKYSVIFILLYSNTFRQRSNVDNLSTYAARRKSVRSAHHGHARRRLGEWAISSYTVWVEIRDGVIVKVWEYVDAAWTLAQMQSAGIELPSFD
jgi:hypothetical protein